jgi:hypothetical protein
VTFPAAIGEFRRFRLTPEPGGQGLNAGYAYVTADARMAATVFARRPSQALPNPPGLDLCQAMMQSGLEAERRREPAPKLGPVAPMPVAAGWRAVGFTVEVPSTSPINGVTENYYYCTEAGDLGVFILFQHAPSFDARALEKSFIEGFALPAR